MSATKEVVTEILKRTCDEDGRPAFGRVAIAGLSIFTGFTSAPYLPLDELKSLREALEAMSKNDEFDEDHRDFLYSALNFVKYRINCREH